MSGGWTVFFVCECVRACMCEVNNCSELFVCAQNMLVWRSEDSLGVGFLLSRQSVPSIELR